MSFRPDLRSDHSSRFAVEPLESRVLMAVGPAIVWGGVPWQTAPASVVPLNPGGPPAPTVPAEPPPGEPPPVQPPPGQPPVPTDPPPAEPGNPGPPEPLPPTGRSPLGGNLNVESDRVQDLPFTDLVKTTRGFYNLAGRVAQGGKPAFASTDANGWPTEDFAFSAADNAEYGVQITPGTYPMSFSGPPGATVSVRRDAPGGAGAVPADAPLPTLEGLGYNAATGVHTYDVVVPSGVRTLAFNFRSTSGQVRNVKVLQPGYSLGGYPTFRNEYVGLLRNLAPNVIRLKDWVHTDDNVTADWSDRPKTTDATQAKVATPGGLQPAKGIAWEYAIQLVNTLGSHVWVTVPAHATDDYVRQLATLLRQTLSPGLTIYLEYSNEVWNSVYEQYHYNRRVAGAEVVAAARAGGQSSLNYDNRPVDTSKADGGPNAGIWAERRYARRSREVGDIFKSVWTSAGLANPINNRVRVVLGGQVAVLSRFDNMLRYISTNFGDPKNYFYALGIAPYINLGPNQDKPGLTKDQVLSSLNAGVNNWQKGTVLSTAKAKASMHGLKLMAYEGGIDTFGSASIAAKRAAVLDPRIKDIIARYLNVWYSKGGHQFNWYTLGARSYNSPYGTWSIAEDIRDYNEPKIEAFRAVRDANLGNGN